MKKTAKKINRKKRKKISKIISNVFIPTSTQSIISFLFKDFDVKTGIMQINDEEYSICMEYTDVSFAKADDEDAENIFFKWLEYLHSFKDDTHIEIVNASVPIKTKRYIENYVFDTNLENKEQKQISEELNELVTNALGTNEETLINKRYIIISIKAKNFVEANALFMNIYLKTERKLKELKSEVRLVPIKERLEFIYNYMNTKTLEEQKIDDIIEYAKDKNISIYDAIAPQKISMRESDFIEIEDKKFMRMLYVSKLPKSMTPRFYNKITTLQDINIITTLNITPTNSAKAMKQVSKSLSAMETERLEKIKRAGKSNLDYSYVVDKKLEDKISNAEQLQVDLQKNNQRIFKNNFLICVIANSFEELEDNTLKIYEVASEMLIEVRPLLWQQLEALQNTLPLGHNTIQIQRSLTSEATAVNVPFNSKNFLHEKSIYYGINLVSKNAIFCDRKKLLNGNGCVLATSGAGKSFSIKTIIEQILLRYPDDDVCIIEPQNEYSELLRAFNGQKVVLSSTSKTYINPFDLSIGYSLSDGDESEVKSKVEYIIAFIESIVGTDGLSAGQKTIIDRCTKIAFEKYEESGLTDESLIPTLPDFYQILSKQPEEEAKTLSLILERYVKGSIDMFSKKTNINIKNRLVSFDISQLSSSLKQTGYLVVLDHIQNRLAKNKALGKYTWTFVDEGHILLDNVYSAQYLANFFKTGRKLNAMNTFISQQSSHLLRSEYGKDILSNSEFALILKQKPLDLPKICEIFGISEEESMYIQGDAPSGQGLVVYGSDIIPFRNKIPKDYLIYRINNTDSIAQARG